MVVDFVKEYAKLFAFEPDKIKVDVVDREGFKEILIYAKKFDAGRIIGKDGTMVKALKTVINGCKAKENIEYKITVKIADE